MNPDDFETRLRRQPLRAAPGTWRSEILNAAQASGHRPSTVEPRHAWLSTLSSQLSTLLWPHPRAWAGLAAAWILIAALQIASRESKPAEQAKAIPSPQIAAEIEVQRKMLAELLADRTFHADPIAHEATPTRPRSERRVIQIPA